MARNKFHLELEDIRAAAARLEGVILKTPLLPSSSRPGVLLKAENLQVAGSFKIRPAYNQLVQLSPEERRRGVVTSSSGNFAQATALAARLLGTSAKIVMMESANALKVARTRRWGGEVVFCEDRFEARFEMVEGIGREEGRAIVHPFDHPAAIAGTGTIALEVLEQWPAVEHVVVPVSGGGLIGGISLAAKSLKPSVKVWGVQAEGSNAAHLSFQQGRLCSIQRARTMADGLTATRPGEITFPLIQAHVEGIVTVKETTILQAVRELLWKERLLVEPSGAVTLAAVLEGQVPARETVLVLSGGVIHPEVLARVAADLRDRWPSLE